ncbi:hypothetical protein ACE012_19150 [Shewanella xiamenensis]|uniref:hypothetical protein n=1 Tax=Shewanella xiamenensis TaxID=332186 RepID=UPI0035B81F34
MTMWLFLESVKMKCNLIHKAPIWATRLLSIMGLLLSVINPLQAANSVESNETLPAVGRMPTATNVKFDKVDIALGESLNITYSYQDEDGDIDGGSDVTWFYNDTKISGASGLGFTPVLNINTPINTPCSRNFAINAEITPKSLNGAPLVGLPVTTNSVKVTVPEIPGFTFPVQKNHTDAIAYCNSLGARLPTRAELITLFNTYTTGGINLQLAEKYGWPLSNSSSTFCGSYGFYWTSDAISGTAYYTVDLHNPNASSGTHEVYTNDVTCIY